MDKKKLDEQFEEIEKSLTEVKESTEVVAKNVEDQTAHVKESLEGMTGVLDGMKTNDDKREQELLGLKTDIENIKTMIPKVKNSSGLRICASMASEIMLFTIDPRDSPTLIFIMILLIPAHGEEQGITSQHSERTPDRD